MSLKQLPDPLPEYATVEEIIEAFNQLLAALAPEEDLVIKDITDDLEKHPDKLYNTRAPQDIRQIVYHHVGDPSGADVSPHNTAWYHIHVNDWPGIAYQFMIAKDGTVWQTQKLTTVSYHCDGMRDEAGNYVKGLCNLRSVGVCLVGSFINGRVPTDAQLESARLLNTYLMRVLQLEPGDIVGHKDVPGHTTRCPGDTWPQWKDRIIP